MVFYVSYIKDSIGSNYIGINIYQDLISEYLKKLKEDIIPNDYDEYVSYQQNRDHNSYHITVINPIEYNQLSKKYGVDKFVNSLEPIFKYEIDDLKMMGIGTATRNENRAYFVVCQSDKLNAIRNRYDLPKQDFHITLGFRFKDVFGVRKNEIISIPSKFLKLLKEEFYKKENFNFVKKIQNFDLDEDSEIIPVSINDKYLKVLCEDYLMDIGLFDTENKLYIFTKYKKESEINRLPITEFLKFIKNN